MKKRKAFIQIVCIVLVIMMVLSITVMVVAPSVYASSSSDIREEINDLNSQKNEIQGRMDEIQAEIDSLDYEKSNTLEKKLILDQRNLLAQQELDVIQEQIDIIDGMLSSLQEDLADARAEEQLQKERWLSRVRAMEESSSVDYLQVLFDATSFSDLLTRVDLVGEVMDYDEDLEAQYIAARQKVEQLEGEAETMFADNETRRQELETKKAQLETDIAAACALIAQMEQDTDDYEAVLAQEEETQAQIQALIVEKEKEFQKAKAAEEAERLRQLAAQQAAQQAAAAQQGGSAPAANGTTWMIWPSYTRQINSYYGMRTNPVSGIYKLHAGIDIGASYGTKIYAAASGTVILAGWNGGYGNCVMVNHGNGYTTLYGHMSSIAAYSGQTVSQGQVLGYVGSTGNSTGPHLHFEVRASSTGGSINPLAFSYFN